ncbi:hypothetical protein K525DRAFT_259803 [Schizophyllum commune Loenen D]|nr:hypothetical protein K525DRAFT_259803 [Schizophyllum commune Loenen D]
MEGEYTPEEIAHFTKLWHSSLIPLHACLLTLEDEIRFIWVRSLCRLHIPRSFGKYMFLWIRYYSIALLLFDVTQIHVFTIPGVTNDTVCVAMDTIIRVVGAIALWSIEIVMQLRIYALYDCSKTIAIVNGAMFIASIGTFLWILIHNAMGRSAVIADVIHLPLPGCPSIHTGIEWAQWVPATAFEAVLFFFALHKTLHSTAQRFRRGERISLYQLVLRDQIIYFFLVTVLLVFNNLMVVGVTKIPWFSYSPFHAALGVLTTRMMINTRKASAEDVCYSDDTKLLTTSNGMVSPSTEENTLPWNAAPSGGFAARYGGPLSFGDPTSTYGSLEPGYRSPKLGSRTPYEGPFAQYADNGKDSMEMGVFAQYADHGKESMETDVVVSERRLEWVRPNEDGSFSVLNGVVSEHSGSPHGSPRELLPSRRISPPGSRER